jgi:predicted metal-dependent hydrolase
MATHRVHLWCGPRVTSTTRYDDGSAARRAAVSDGGATVVPMSQTVVEIPGLPDGVEVRRSTRRRRSVTAYREGGRTIVVVPARMSKAEIRPFVDELVGRLQAREQRTRRTDDELHQRAIGLARRYLDGRAEPRSVRWVTNQRRRWGSCTPADATIRLSDRLAAMPAYVVDYVLLHELVHLLVPGHGADFEAWMVRYPRLVEARAFLAGVDHATGHGLAGEPDDEPDGIAGAEGVSASGDVTPAPGDVTPAPGDVNRAPGDADDAPTGAQVIGAAAVDVTDGRRGVGAESTATPSRRPRPEPGSGAEPLF